MPKLDHTDAIKTAVRLYWRSKKASLKRSRAGSRVDQGQRGGATSGKNFDGFAKLFTELTRELSSKGLEIFQKKTDLALPGHFRPTKQWDLVAMYEGRLIAAIEFKSLGGPSFGNNANNRCEEALGSGLDLSLAQREGLLGKGACPFVGYCILVEDEENSRKPPVRQSTSRHFSSDPVFASASYQGRMRILCERMVQERLYSAAAVITSPPNAARSGAFANLSAETSLNRLVARYLAHLEVETEH